MPNIIPFGNRILVKRRKVGEKVGSIVMPDIIKEHDTDLADVIFVPDLTFSDKHILDNAEKIVKGLTAKACEGDAEALKALLDVNDFVRLKSIKPNDVVMISRYVGTTFHEKGKSEDLTLVDCRDIIGLVAENKEETNET